MDVKNYSIDPFSFKKGFDPGGICRYNSDSMMQQNSPAQPNKSLIHGLACLQALATADKGVGTRELARQLDLDRTRVSRLLGTLSQLGLAQKTSQRKYKTGPGIHILAAQSLRASGLLSEALPYLEDLMKYHLVVAMGLLWNRHVCYLFHAKPGNGLQEGIRGFELYPATKSSIGMILLSQKTDSEIRDIYRGVEIPEYKSVSALLRKIETFRKQGYSEVLLEDRSFAVKVGEPAHAAIGMSGHVTKAGVKKYIAIMRRMAEDICKKLE